MRFRIDVVRSKDPDGWSISVHPHGDSWSAPPTRVLPRTEAAGLGFPKPPAGTNLQGPGAALAGGVQEVAEVFQRIRDQQTRNGDLASFGHYLFETLLGASTWRAMCEHARDEATLDLELSLRSDDRELMRLPWEALHDGKEFLTLMPLPAVSLTRVVSDAAAVKPPPLELPLRVLFVVGGSLKDKRLQPGAEYLGLMRSLRAQGLALRSQLLLEANREMLEKEVSAFKPAVVHVIGHGGMDAQGGYIEVMSTTAGQAQDRLGAKQLETLLRPGGAPPPLLVLNTCYSGAQPEGVNLGTPLAVELVETGFPLVVAMAGRVLDTACRLFTRQLYQALVQGSPLPSAVATGRSAGHRLAANDPDAVDWVLPILVTPPLERMVFAVGDKPPEFLRDTELKLQPDRAPSILCDRHDFLIAYQKLALKEEPKVLVVRVQDPLAGAQDYKLGMTRLLQELAVQALDDGYLPCRIQADERSFPKSPLEIVVSILEGTKATAKSLLPQFETQLEEILLEVEKLEMLLAGNTPPAALHASLNKMRLKGKPYDEPQMLRAALLLDLRNLGDQMGRRPLVIVDGVHWFAEVTDFLHMLQPQGLGEGVTSIPVIFSCKTVNVPDVVREHLQLFMKEKSGYIKVMDLAPLVEDETEKHLVYQQFLLGWCGPSGEQRKPLVINRKLPPKQVQTLIHSLHKEVRGIPSRLRADTTASAIRLLEDFEMLLPANDEDALEQWKRQQAALAKKQGGGGTP